MTAPTAPKAQASNATGRPRLVGSLAHGTRWGLRVAALAAAVVMVLAARQQPSYLAGVSLLATQRAAGPAAFGLPQPRPIDGNAYRAAVSRGPVAGDALRALLGRPPTAAELDRLRADTRVRVRPADSSSVIRIEVVAFDPTRASDAALALADALTRWERARSATGLRQGAAALRADLARLDAALQSVADGSDAAAQARRTQLQALRDQRARELDLATAHSDAYAGVGLVSAFAPGSVDVHRLSRWIVVRGLIAAFVALVTVYAVFYVRGLFDPYERAPAALAALAGLPIVTRLPPLGPANAAAGRDAVDALRIDTLRAAQGRLPIVVGLTSPRRAASKQGVAVALAASFLRSGRRTLLVDADLRNPAVARQLGVAPVAAAPFSWHLENPRMDVSPGIVALDGTRTCDVVPGHKPYSDPQGLLERNLEIRLAAWRLRYDVIILDGPPVLPHADMLTIAPECDVVALCADPAASTRHDVAEAGELLRRATSKVEGSKVQGVILTNASGA